MEFNEFAPRCGWKNYYRRRNLFRKVASAIMALAAFAVYAAMVTLAESI